MKRVKFGVSRHFLENPSRKWPEILHADVSWPLSELIRLWLQFVNFFLILMLFWLNETGKIWGFQAFWSCSVDFPHYGDPLVEIGHSWRFWALSGKRVGVNVEGRAEAYFRRFASNAVCNELFTSCLSAGRSVFPMCFPRKPLKPYFNSIIVPHKEQSLLWHAIWVNAGRPREGILAQIMRQTRAK